MRALINSQGGKVHNTSQAEFLFASPVGEFGAWIFDDGERRRDQFQLTATEVGGATWDSPIVNRNEKSHGVAGFLGVVSDVGIERVVMSGLCAETPTEPADFDGDGDVDLGDYLSFLSCFTGPGGAPPACCHPRGLDLDGDEDMDLVDLVAFQAAFTGAR